MTKYRPLWSKHLQTNDYCLEAISSGETDNLTCRMRFDAIYDTRAGRRRRGNTSVVGS